MPDSRAALFEQRPAELEVILPEPDQCFRWYEHDYPYALARWNHHPEFEIHLIRQGSGKLVAGDYIGAFGAGHVALIGPDLPHDWIGDLAPGEYLPGRDVVLQFDGAALLALRGTLPELGELQDLFARARRGLEFTGATAVQAARLLEAIGPAQGLERLILFLQLINTLLKAPTQNAHSLASACYVPTLDDRSSERINKAFDYLLTELTDDPRLSVIARRLDMSEPGFCASSKELPVMASSISCASSGFNAPAGCCCRQRCRWPTSALRWATPISPTSTGISGSKWTRLRANIVAQRQ